MQKLSHVTDITDMNKAKEIEAMFFAELRKMTPQERIEAFTKSYRKKIGEVKLDQYHIILFLESLGDDNFGELRYKPNKIMHLKINPKFFLVLSSPHARQEIIQRERAALKNIIVHELTHVLDPKSSLNIKTKKYPDADDFGSEDYFKHPSEVDAFTNAIISSIDDFLDHGILTRENLESILRGDLYALRYLLQPKTDVGMGSMISSEDFLIAIEDDEKLRRQFLKRLNSYFN